MKILALDLGKFKTMCCFFDTANSSIKPGEVTSNSVSTDRWLNDRLRASGLSHQQIADHLGTSRSFVTKAMNSDKSWPAHRRLAALQLIETQRRVVHPAIAARRQSLE